MRSTSTLSLGAWHRSRSSCRCTSRHRRHNVEHVIVTASPRRPIPSSRVHVRACDLATAIDLRLLYSTMAPPPNSLCSRQQRPLRIFVCACPGSTDPCQPAPYKEARRVPNGESATPHCLCLYTEAPSSARKLEADAVAREWLTRWFGGERATGASRSPTGEASPWACAPCWTPSWAHWVTRLQRQW